MQYQEHSMNYRERIGSYGYVMAYNQTYAIRIPQGNIFRGGQVSQNI